jgi:hypothetical protein
MSDPASSAKTNRLRFVPGCESAIDLTNAADNE